MRFLEAQAQDVGFGSDGEDVSEVLFVGSCVSQVPRPDEHVQRSLHVTTCFAAAQSRAFHATRRRHFVWTTVLPTCVHSSSSPFHPSHRFGFGKEVRAGSNPKSERKASLSNQDRTRTKRNPHEKNPRRDARGGRGFGSFFSVVGGMGTPSDEESRKKFVCLPSWVKRRRRRLRVHAPMGRMFKPKDAVHSLGHRVHASELHPVFTNHPCSENLRLHRRRHSMFFDTWSYF